MLRSATATLGTLLFSLLAFAENPQFKPDFPLVLPDAHAGIAYSFDLSKLLVNQGSGDLKYSADPDPAHPGQSPTWIVPSTSKVLGGTPPKGTTGTFYFLLSVQNNVPNPEGGDVNHPTVITVKDTPIFANDPINLGQQKEDGAFSFDLSTTVTNPEAGPFTFAVTGIPSWMKLTSSALSGTPPWNQAHTNAGNYTFQVTATGPGGTTTVGAIGGVDKLFKPPQWTSTPNTLTDAFEGKPYNQSIAGFAKALEAGALTYTVVAAPAWVTVGRRAGTNGTITGTPQHGNIGPVKVTVSLAQTVLGQTLTGGNADFNFNVLQVLFPPVWKNDPLDLGTQREDQNFTIDLKSFVTDPMSSPSVTFTAKNLPTWMHLDPGGLLTGAPPWSAAHTLVGPYSGLSFTVQALGGSATVSAKGTVAATIKPPIWDGNPITLTDAIEDIPYSVDVTGHVINPEGKTLQFSVVGSPPPWLKLTQAGIFVGTPDKNAIGSVAVVAHATTVIQGKTYDTGPTTFTFNVIHVNHAPVWSANPLVLPNASSGKIYTQSLAGSATDPDGDTLKFGIVGQAPTWVTVTPDGTVSGMPGPNDVGLNSFKVSASDPEGASAQTVVQITVIKSVTPPTWKKPVVLTSGTEDVSYTEDLAKYVSNPDNLPLSFALLDSHGNLWVKVSAQGAVTGTPSAQYVGVNKLTIQVSSVGQPSDAADALLEVVHKNHAPYWVINPIQVTATEDQGLIKDISVYAGDKDIATFNDRLTFSLVASPAGSTNWLSISPEGVLTGTPGAPDVGSKQYIVRVADSLGLVSDATLIINTKHVNHAPKWVKDPIILPDAKEGVGYTAILSDSVTDPDTGDTFTFQKIAGSGADWANVSTTGIVSGTPARKDKGINTFKVRVYDQGQLYADTTVQITVVETKHPPYWTENPLDLGTAYEDKSFSFDLTPFAIGDGLNDVLTFSKGAGGPDWLMVSSSGQISGVPLKANIGNFKVTLQVSNSAGQATTIGVGVVIHVNHDPVINISALDFTVKERQLVTADLSQPQYIVDVDGDKLTCTATGTLSWVKLDTNCKLTLSPTHAEVRPTPHSYAFTVTDGKAVASGAISIHVIRDPQKPICDPNIVFTAKTNVAFSDSLKPYCHDLDGVELTFVPTGGWPAWLGLASAGELSGTPGNGDISEKILTFTAKNDLLGTDATFSMKVVPGKQIDQFQVDKAVPGAPTDNLWVVDNSRCCDFLMSALKANISVFYNALNKAGVALHHAGVMLSSDARPEKGDGMPVVDRKIPGDPMMFTWEMPNIVADFVRRVKLAWVGDLCENCSSSPIWSMHQFYGHASTLPIYHNGYFRAGAPSDVLIVSRQRDHYVTFTRKDPQFVNYKPADFAKDFIAFSQAEHQNLRVSVIAPECPPFGGLPGSGEGLISQNPELAGSPNAYKVVVNATHGVYYPACTVNWQKLMNEYAQKVIFRAFVNANHTFTLTKIPIETQTITVTLGGVQLVGNTGNSTDQWRYDGSSNTITLYWENIDQSIIKPGDQVTIQYRVS
ncbi:MAG: hypothetical protein HYR96_01285 [Deltaproteobacteria bacterium]|nr:hypothetical protein [Deltaproteobacteria bacterium]MBI3294352.1 hypothetical protein [Deltaproteobacteria bacterium]